MATTDSATFYVRKTKTKHTKQFISQDLTNLLVDTPAIEIDMSLYGKSDSQYYHIDGTLEKFLTALDKESGAKGHIEEVFITDGTIEVTKSSSSSWKQAMFALEAAFEQLTDEQPNFVPIEFVASRSIAGASRR